MCLAAPGGAFLGGSVRYRIVSVLTAVLTLLGLALAAAPAHAQTIAQDKLVDPNPANFTPHVLDGQVWAVAQVGNKIVLGGSFTQAQNASGGATLHAQQDSRVRQEYRRDRHRLRSELQQHRALARRLSRWAVGLCRRSVRNSERRHGSQGRQTNISNGARTAGFNPATIDAVVWDMKLAGNRLFIGGAFTRVGAATRTYLAELNAQTGALSANLDLTIAGTHNGGQTFVHKFDVSPDGSTMVVTGNFATIQGQDRVQMGVVDLTTPQATLADWQTERWKPMCYSVFQYYLNDVDFAPDGSYFVLSSMGGYGSGPPTLCDTPCPDGRPPRAGL